MRKSKPRHPLIGWMKGTVTIAAGVDLTEPADPYWGLDLDEFKARVEDREPPRGVAPALQALWWSATGNWKQAHEIVMAHESDRDCAWVHAYLHRVEGDAGNAAHWYRQARRPVAKGANDAEWDAIVAGCWPWEPRVSLRISRG